MPSVPGHIPDPAGAHAPPLCPVHIDLAPELASPPGPVCWNFTGSLRTSCCSTQQLPRIHVGLNTSRALFILSRWQFYKVEIIHRPHLLDEKPETRRGERVVVGCGASTPSPESQRCASCRHHHLSHEQHTFILKTLKPSLLSCLRMHPSSSAFDSSCFRVTLGLPFNCALPGGRPHFSLNLYAPAAPSDCRMRADTRSTSTN